MPEEAKTVTTSVPTAPAPPAPPAPVADTSDKRPVKLFRLKSTRKHRVLLGVDTFEDLVDGDETYLTETQAKAFGDKFDVVDPAAAFKSVSTADRTKITAANAARRKK